MEFIIFVLIGGVAVFFFLCFATFGKMSSNRREAADNAPRILDEAFDGRDDVVVKVTMSSLPYETYVLGAKERGYRLASETSEGRYGLKTLIFERADH